MKKRFRLFGLVYGGFIACLFSGCSYGVQFYIHNNSDAPVTISYKVIMPSTHGVFITDPTIFDFDNLTDQLDYPEGAKVKFDSSSKTVTAQLERNEALFIGTQQNFTLENPVERTKACRYIEELVIVKSNADTVVYSAKMVCSMLKELGNYKVGIRIE